MPRKRVQRQDELRLVDVSGIEDFGLETVPSLLGFSCDEADGPVVVTFAPGMEHVEIRLDVLRRLMDDAEADILRHRREWQSAFPEQGQA